MDKIIKELLKKLSQAEEDLFKSYLPNEAAYKAMVEKRDSLRAEVDRYSRMIWEVQEFLKQNAQRIYFEDSET